MRLKAAFANAFLKALSTQRPLLVRCLVDYLPFEKNDLRKFLLSLIDERPDEPILTTKPSSAILMTLQIGAT